MTKIKEYMELLTSELEAFQDDVNRLEAINNQLKDVKISIDLQELKSILQEHSTQLKYHQAYQEQFYLKIKTLFKKAKLFLVWMMVGFVVVVFVLLGVLVLVF
jgi:hypothetical protein